MTPIVHCCSEVLSMQQLSPLQLTDNLFDFLFEGSPVGVYVVQHGTFRRVNQAFQRLTGYPLGELTEMTPLDLILPEERRKVREQLAKMLRGERRMPCEVRILTRSGRLRWVIESVTYVKYSGARAILGYSMDITKRKQIEGELRRTVQRLYGTLTGTIVLLSKLLRLKDPYTAIHQERVAHLAATMAKEMGLSAHQVRGIHVAGLVHDIGKLSIPSEVLCRPGRLSEPEFAMLKEHPRIGYELLRDINFPWPVAEIVLQHHERLDGSGYPYGLKGDQILPEARILAVADVVEAIVSHRPYRGARGRERAIEEITRNIGKLYDPAAVAACLKVIHRNKVRITPYEAGVRGEAILKTVRTTSSAEAAS